MDANSKTKFATAVMAGYVLGRTKKGKLALGVLTLAAGRSPDPKALIGQGVRKLTDTPQFEQLEDQVRSELLAAGRSALTAATNRSLGSLTDSLQQRTNALRNGGASEEADLDEEPPEENAAKDEGEEDEEESPRQPRRPQAKKRTSKKTAAKKGPEKKPPAKRAASSGGRRR